MPVSSPTRRLSDIAGGRIGPPPQGGMYRTPASEVFPDAQGHEPRLLRVMRHLANRQFGERFRKWKGGDTFRPEWELSHGERVNMHKAMADFGGGISCGVAISRNSMRRWRRRRRSDW